jgi:hypothetical protein
MCLAACLLAAPLTAQALPPPEPDWSFDLAPYVWLPSASGTVTAAGRNADLDDFGAGSHPTWNAASFLGYDFELCGAASTFFVGYRGLYQDYSTGSGLKKFALDATLYSPALGLGFSF